MQTAIFIASLLLSDIYQNCLVRADTQRFTVEKKDSWLRLPFGHTILIESNEFRLSATVCVWESECESVLNVHSICVSVIENEN